jgi:hypothetical protein
MKIHEMIKLVLEATNSPPKDSFGSRLKKYISAELKPITDKATDKATGAKNKIIGNVNAIKSEIDKSYNKVRNQDYKKVPHILIGGGSLATLAAFHPKTAAIAGPAAALLGLAVGAKKYLNKGPQSITPP